MTVQKTTELPEGAEGKEEQHAPSRTERLKQAVSDKVQSGENSKKIADAAERVKEVVRETAAHPGETAADVSNRITHGISSAPGKAEQALFTFNREYGSTKEKTITGALQKAGGAVREYQSENLPFAGSTGAPAFSSTKGQRPTANIFRYGGGVTFDGVHGAKQPNFGMHQHPVNFGQGSALPHGAMGGSGTPTTGSAVNFGNLHGFGGIAHTSMSTPSFGMNDGILKGAGVGAGVRTGGSTFGMNDGILKGAAIGKLNFTQGVLKKIKASKPSKKGSKK